LCKSDVEAVTVNQNTVAINGHVDAGQQKGRDDPAFCLTPLEDTA
jgi:hypothetical protein